MNIIFVLYATVTAKYLVIPWHWMFSCCVLFDRNSASLATLYVWLATRIYHATHDILLYTVIFLSEHANTMWQHSIFYTRRIHIASLHVHSVYCSPWASVVKSHGSGKVKDRTCKHCLYINSSTLMPSQETLITILQSGWAKLANRCSLLM